MRKLLLIIGLFISLAGHGQTVYEYYSSPAPRPYIIFNGSPYRFGQTFTIGTTGTNENFILDYITLDISKVAAYTVYVQIYATSGGLPSGTAISSGSVSAGTDIDDGNIIMTPVVLQAGTMYAIVVYSTVEYTGLFQAEAGTIYQGGSVITYNGSVWSNFTGYDLVFAVYGHRNPVITSNPESITRCEGTSATFSVTSTANSPTYQWRKNGFPISGATSASYTIPSVTTANAASYSVTVTDGLLGTFVTSSSATLTISAGVVITTQSISLTRCVGSIATFSVTATGSGLTYQWKKNGSNITGATGSSYSISNVATTDAGAYTCTVANSCNSVTSNTANLTVNTLVAITSQPASVEQLEGTNATFSVIAIGSGLTYQWKKNGSNISGATNNTYTISNISEADEASYTVTVTGTCNTVTSNIATLTVTESTGGGELICGPETYLRFENNATDGTGNHTWTAYNSAGYTTTNAVEGTYAGNLNASSTNRFLSDNIDWTTGGGTIAFNFRTERTTGTGVILTNQTTSQSTKGFLLIHDTEFDRLRLMVHNGSTHGSSYTSNNSILANTQYHIIIRWMDVNDDEVKIWINGILANSDDSTAYAGGGLNATWSLGCSKEANAYSMYGTVDKFEAYKWALSNSQVTALYNARAANSTIDAGCSEGTPAYGKQVLLSSIKRNILLNSQARLYAIYPYIATPPVEEPDTIYEGNPYANGVNVLYVDVAPPGGLGSSNNTGTSPESPVTIADVALLYSSYDTIAFSDTIHYAELSFTNWDGIASSFNEIGVYHRYGNQYATISAYEQLGNFSFVSGNIWSIVDNDLPAGGLKIPDGVGDLHSRFITPFNYLLRSDGAYYAAGRYPANGFLNSTGAGPVGARTTYLDDTETTFASGYWDNALINFQIEQWDLERAKVGTYNGSRYSFSTIASNALYMTSSKAANRYYYLSNHINCLAKNGDWAYRDDIKTLYMYSTTNPNTYSYKFVKNEKVLGLTSCDYVRVKGIRTEGGMSMGILVSGGSNITIDSCSIDFSGANGVHAYNVSNLTVQNSTIQNTSGAGIFGAGCTNEVYNYNRFKKIGYDYAMLCDNIGSNVAIRCEYRHGTLTINGNYIKEAGYSGITFNSAVASPQPGNVVIKNNYISKVLQMMADGGGIYTNVAPAEDGFPSITFLFRNNYIDSCGSTLGYQFANNVPTYAGIYLDSYAQNVTSDSNVIVHADYGYMTNGYKSNIFRNNLMYDPSNYQQTGYGAPAAYRMTTTGWGGQPNGTKFTKNIAIMRDSTDAAFGLNWNGSTYTKNNTDVDSNKYFNPFDENANEVSKTYNTSTGVQAYHPLSYFQTSTFLWEDQTTFNTPDWTYQDVTGITRDQFVQIYFNHSETAHTFYLGDLTLKNVVTGSNVTGSITLQPHKGAAYFYVSGSFTGVDNPIYNPKK